MIKYDAPHSVRVKHLPKFELFGRASYKEGPIGNGHLQHKVFSSSTDAVHCDQSLREHNKTYSFAMLQDALRHSKAESKTASPQASRRDSAVEEPQEEDPKESAFDPNDQVEKIDAKGWRPYRKYIFQESQLHVKTGGHYWNETFGSTSLNPEFEPERGIQFRLPYVKIPKRKALLLQSSEGVPAEFQDEKSVFVPFHPSYLGKEHGQKFREYINHKKYKLVEARRSDFWATPTSSYRTLVVKTRVGDADRFFQVKVGAPGKVLGATRDLRHEEVDQSVRVARKIHSIPELQHKHSGLEVLSDDSGIIHKWDEGENRSNTVPLNCIFRTLPKPQSDPETDVEYYSFAALLSNAEAGKGESKTDPIAYRLATNYMKHNHISDKGEGVKKFMEDIINRFTESTSIFLKHGIAFEPHSQNAGVKIKDGLIQGFFMRDGGGFLMAEEDHSMHQGLSSKQQATIVEKRQRYNERFNGTVVQSMSVFFSFYVIEKLGKVFLRDSVAENAYGKYGLDHPQLQGRYRAMSEKNVLIQSGPNLLNRHLKGHTPLDPRPLEREEITSENRDMFFDNQVLDGLRQLVKHSYIKNIEKHLGAIPEDAMKALLEFKAIERGAVDAKGETIQVNPYAFNKWILDKRSIQADKSQ